MRLPIDLPSNSNPILSSISVIDLNEYLTEETVQNLSKINNFSQSTIIDHEKTLMQ